MDFLLNFFTDHFSNYVWLVAIFISAIPVMESKIAIPFVMNHAIWGANALSPFSAFVFSFIGSILPSYLIIIIVRKLKQKTSYFIYSKKMNKYKTKSLKMGKLKPLHKYIALTSFVALPIPMTGVWSGSLVAGLTENNILYSFISIATGSLISGTLITILCQTFSNSLSVLLVSTLIIIVLFIVADLILNFIKKYKN